MQKDKEIFSLIDDEKKRQIEGIELMRALELGMKIGTFVIKGSDFAVDVKTDLFKAINVMPKDKIRKLY